MVFVHIVHVPIFSQVYYLILFHIIHKLCMFSGGRGLKMEMWNDSRPQRLEEVLTYNSSRPGYSVQWVDSLSYSWPLELDNFVTRFSGFFVPMETDNYYFLAKADDRVQMYFSKTGRPEDKVLHEQFKKHCIFSCIIMSFLAFFGLISG